MQNQKQHNDFKFFLPVDIEKGTNAKGNKVYKIKGQASKQRKDSQGEVMKLDGMDVSNLKVINWNHKSKDNPDAYIGEVQGVNFKNDEMHFSGELFPEMPMAKGCINLMKALKKRGKQLGVSIEGSVVERGSKDPKNPKYNTVLKSKLTALAVTPNPINSDTYAELLEKGYTDSNEWEYDEETEVIMKSYESGELEEAEKSYTVEDNQDLVKEDVEGSKNKKKKDEEGKEENEGNKQSLSKKVSKADVYEKIFDYFYEIDITKAKKVYNLIEKLTAMSDKKEITDKEINKAFEILEQQEASAEEEVVKSEDEIALEKKEKEEYSEMVSKAVEVAKGMLTAGFEKEDLRERLVEKGYGEKVIDDTINEVSGVEKSTPVVDNSEVLKAIADSKLNINTKFGAIADIYKSQHEVLQGVVEKNEKLEGDLEKSFEIITELNNTIQKFASKPGTRRSASSFKDKNFTDNEGQPIQKSEGGKKSFNLKDVSQRTALVNLLNEESGINKSGEDFDRELVQIAQGLEIAKSVDEKALGRLSAMGIEILA